MKLSKRLFALLLAIHMLLSIFAAGAIASSDEESGESTLAVYYTAQDAVDIAKVLYTECRSIPSTTEKACVAWTILNRADMQGISIYSVVRAPRQFAFKEGTPVNDDLLTIAYDVLDRWNLEKNGQTEVGRVLPKDYIYFNGDGKHNYFRNSYKKPYKVWDYSLPSPYES